MLQMSRGILTTYSIDGHRYPMNSSFPQFMVELEAARSGNENSERAALIERFRPFLSELAQQYLGYKYHARIGHSDLVQSAIISALVDFSSCRAKSLEEFKAWLRRILVNDIMNKVRDITRGKRDIRKELPGSRAEGLVDDAKSPESKAIEGEDVRRLQVGMQQLTNDQQVVIRLRNQEKLDFPEIGQRMNRSSDSARMLWNRSIQKLAKLLKD